VSDPALSRRAYIRAAAAGALLALVLDVLMLMGWHLDPLRQMGLLGSFYDSSACCWWSAWWGSSGSRARGCCSAC